MKTVLRILCAVLCAALLIGMPFFLSAPTLLEEAEERIFSGEEDDEGGEEDDVVDFGRLFFSTACAEETSVTELSDEEDPFANPQAAAESSALSIREGWALSLDLDTVPPAPDPDRFSETGYEDQTIRVHLEERVMQESVVHAAFVEIASPTQLRTAPAYGINNKRTHYVKTVALQNNAVVAMNGDDAVQDPGKKLFEVRMGQYFLKRKKINNHKDTLVIDKSGDFHIFELSRGLKDYKNAHEGDIMHAFTFGPALVIDGELAKEKTDYGYNPNGREPRSAIGQTGPLSYVFVVVEGRSDKSKGVNHHMLAEIMLELGCVQAYNLDGGNSAELVLCTSPEPLHYKGQNGSDRAQSDIIYFATAVPEEDRE